MGAFDGVTSGFSVQRLGNIVRLFVGDAPTHDGDYNDDGEVDAADFTVWRDNLGSSASLPNDPTPGDVDLDDYITWKTNFGMTTGSGSLSSSAVPEPASLLLLGLSAFGALVLTRSSRQFGTHRS
jgi:hypothetical protein